jgi:hypothetical protein
MSSATTSFSRWSLARSAAMTRSYSAPGVAFLNQKTKEKRFFDRLRQARSLRLRGPSRRDRPIEGPAQPCADGTLQEVSLRRSTSAGPPALMAGHALAGKLRIGVGRTGPLTLNTDVRIIASRGPLVFAVRRNELLEAVAVRSGDGPGTESLEGWLVTVRSVSGERPSASQRR